MKIKSALILSITILQGSHLFGQAIFLDQSRPAVFSSVAFVDEENDSFKDFLFGVTLSKYADFGLSFAKLQAYNENRKTVQANFYPFRLISSGNASAKIYAGYTTVNSAEKGIAIDYIGFYSRHKIKTLGASVFHRCKINTNTELVPEAGLYWQDIEYEYSSNNDKD